MQVEEWLGASNKLGIDIFNRKYRFNNETFDEWLQRVSGNDEEIKKLIIEKKFLFGGRILANRGLNDKGKKVCYSNCFVLEPPKDNIESIFDCAKKMARTYSMGGGVGIDISNLSPRGAKINNAANETTGSVSFMDLYSLTTGLIGQSGRRGALMISINDSHPDLLEFIDVKSDLNKVTKANISIRISDEFMQAVKENKEWELKFIRDETEEVITKKINARDIFHKIAENNWKMAEPGALFWDNITNYNILSEDDNFEYTGVNPCFTGDMKLLTEDGYKEFKELNDKEVNIINANGEISKGKVWCSGEKKIVELYLSNKQRIKCTPNHVFKLTTNEECEAKDLLNKRVQIYVGQTNKSDDTFVKLGFIQGDGCLGRLNSETHRGLEVNIGHKDKEVFNLFNITPIEGKHDYYINGYNEILIKYGFDGSSLPERVLPITYTSWTKEQKLSFLKGCYSANGSVVKNHRVSYKTTSKVFALQLQKALNEFGITANLTTNKPKNVEFNNGVYLCKESYDININKLNDIITFYQNIGFVQLYKIDGLVSLIKDKCPKVLSIKELGVEKVYDFTEPLIHWGVVEGFIAHNCAEEPLPSGGSCLLGSINLSEFVENPFTNKAIFRFDLLKDTVEKVVKAMNDILDEGLPFLPLEEQRESAKNWRQIGIGIMGLADMLIKMGLKYGDESSLILCNSIGHTLADKAINTSSELAKLYGKYPNYSDSVLKSKFLSSNAYLDTYEKVAENGLRNSQLLTIAPTGSLSTMLGISGGIEPIYSNSYMRKTESLHGKEQYYKVYTPIVQKYIERNNVEESDLPDYFVTAMTLNYKERIGMQAIWQKHIDASISSTVNVPNNFTIQQVEDLYMFAWENKLKGITIYRDGCDRTGILSNNTEENKIDNKNSNTHDELPWGTTIQASDDLIGRKSKIISGCGAIHIQGWFDPEDGRLTEIYLSKGADGVCGSWLTSNSRLISAALRTGLSFDYLIDQLKSAPTCPSYAVRTATKRDTSKGNSCPVAVANALIKMQKEVFDEIGIDEEAIELPVASIKVASEPIKLETKYKQETNDICPECNEKLQFQGGCNSCPSCGYSKCL